MTPYVMQHDACATWHDATYTPHIYVIHIVLERISHAWYGSNGVNASSICVTWLVCICHESCRLRCIGAVPRVTWCFHLLLRGVFCCVAWHMNNTSFVSVTWLMHMTVSYTCVKVTVSRSYLCQWISCVCEIIYLYAPHAVFIWQAWLI